MAKSPGKSSHTDESNDGLKEKMVAINRVTKVVKEVVYSVLQH